jgi:rhodanese-related sulfurtransferase
MELAAEELGRRAASPDTRTPNPQASVAPAPAAATLFDARTEVSADARHIAGRVVKHLWIIFVLLPVVAVIFLFATGAIK